MVESTVDTEEAAVESRTSVSSGRDGGRFGLVFNIQRFSLHDGDGIRTVVFLKGCPLACRWCSNPEGQAYGPELVFVRDRCIAPDGCRRCLPACRRGALAVEADRRVDLDRIRCDVCAGCVVPCPAAAIEIAGRWLSVADVLRIVEADGAFYVRSGGGLTLSGGEPPTEPRPYPRGSAGASPSAKS